LGSCDAVIVRSATRITGKDIENAKPGPLKLIIRAGTGLDNIDVRTANQYGIAVRNTPDAPVNAVAELAIGLMLSGARGISLNGHTMRLGKWEKRNGTELRGKTLGLLGLGRVGRRILELGGALGMHTVAWDPVVKTDTTMIQVLRQADYLVLAMPALEEPIINPTTITAMKDGATLINISRGCNVDESALLNALDSGKLRAAGLDVWENEPDILPQLRDHPSVSCTPHQGGSTVEAQARIGREVVEIIRSFPCE
jgi:D-3-phosphoglycerate dehydrogenase